MIPKYIRYKNVQIVGTKFKNRGEFINKMSLSTNITLRREPNNRYDKNAISTLIELDNELISVGYIPKEISQKLSYYLDRNYHTFAVITREIQRKPLFTNGDGHKNFYTFSIDIIITNQNKELIKKQREVNLSNIDYGSNRFYFQSVFEGELIGRLLKMKKELPLYQFKERDSEYLKKIKKMKFYSKDFLGHLGFFDFAAPTGPVNDFLNFLDIGITFEGDEYKLSQFYKGMPLRDSDLLKDFNMITNSDSSELVALRDFDVLCEKLLLQY